MGKDCDIRALTIQFTRKLNHRSILSRIIDYWLSQTDDIESFIHHIIHAPCDFIIQNDRISLFKESIFSIPLRMCTKEQKVLLHKLIHAQYHGENKCFKVHVSLKTFGIRYDRFTHNAIIHQHLDRVYMLRVLISIYQGWFIGTDLSDFARQFLHTILHKEATHFGLHNHPTQQGLYELVQNVSH